jgi:hypothetical protein
MAEENFSSNHGQILVALRSLVHDLGPENLSDEEVQIRGNWLQNGQPLRGVTVMALGEQYDPGTVGTQDIGYVCAIVFAEFDDYDARLTGDQMLAWRELIRRRLTDQRLNVTIPGATDPSEHVCRVLRSGESLSNPNKYPNYSINRTVVVVWLRENNP